MKTLLVGNFGAHNVGDELILSAALNDYPEAWVMTDNGRASQKFCDKEFKTVPFPPTAFRSWWRFCFESTYRAEVKKTKHFDKIVFAGGGLFAIKLRACLLWFLVFRWLKFLNPAAEFRFEYQGVDQGLSGFAKKLTQWTFAKADFISVRDANSQKALKSLNISKVVLTEDRVWLWLNDLAENLKLSFNHASNTKGVILFNALDFCEKDVFEIEHRMTHKTVKFVAFAPSDLKFAPLGIQTVLPKTQQEVFNLFLSSELAIGERLHFMIVAKCFSENAADTFLLRASYSEKVDSFVNEHQITYFSTLVKKNHLL